MDILEKELEDIIYENSNTQLNERGLHVFGKKLRQVRVGNYGVLDLLTIYSENPGYVDLTIYELKKDQINVNTFMQAVRYVKGLKSFIRKTKYSQLNITFSIVLIGKTIDTTSDFIYLTDVLTDNGFESFSLKLYTFKYSLDGMTFNEVGDYSLTNEGFNLKKYQ